MMTSVNLKAAGRRWGIRRAPWGVLLWLLQLFALISEPVRSVTFPLWRIACRGLRA